MWLDGMTDPQISCAIGCSKVTVFNWRSERGLEANGGHGTPQRALAFKSRLASQRATVDCWERRLTDTDSAAKLGISQPAYTQRRIRLGLPNCRKTISTNSTLHTRGTVTLSIRAWCKRLRLNYWMVRSRLRLGWSIEGALTGVKVMAHDFT